MICLFLLSLGMALSSAVAGGVLVESGQRYGNANQLVTQQWLWYGLANLAARLGGGALAGTLPAADGLRTAALILVIPLVCVMALCWAVTPESPHGAAVKDARTMLGEMGALVRSRQLLLVAAFLFCFTYNPGLQTPLYFHLTNEVGFSQDFIGTLGAAAASGSIVGVLVCRALAKRLRLRTMFYICVALGVATTLANFALVDRALALVVYFSAGGLRGVRPRHGRNAGGGRLPRRSGGSLLRRHAVHRERRVDRVGTPAAPTCSNSFFHRQLGPLIVVSAAFTAGSAVLIWLLPERSAEAATLAS